MDDEQYRPPAPPTSGLGYDPDNLPQQPDAYQTQRSGQVAVPAVHEEIPAVAESRPATKKEEEYTLWQGKPAWQGMIFWYIKGIGIMLLVLLVDYALTSMDLWPTAIGVLLALIIVAAPFVLGHLIRSFTSYTITNKKIIIKFGILQRQEQKAFLHRVQNTTIQQRLWERMINVGSIDIDTAGYNPEETGRNRFLFLHGIRRPSQVAAIIDATAWDDNRVP